MNLEIYGFFATYINTKDTVIADEPKKELENTDWETSDLNYQRIYCYLVYCITDQQSIIPTYTWHPDPWTVAVNTLTLHCSQYQLFHAFHHFIWFLKL